MFWNNLKRAMRVGCFSFAALGISAGISSAATLDFTAVNFGNVASFTEDGFDVATTFFDVNFFGNPSPSLQSFSANATVTITLSGGGLFNFSAFDLADGGLFGSDGVTVEGFLMGALQFSDFFAPLDDFVNTASPSTTDIDTLVFTTAASGGFLNLDNIEVSPSVAAVPVPAALPLLAGGFGLLGLLGWRRNRNAVAA